MLGAQAQERTQTGGPQTQQILPLHSDEDVVRLRKQVRDSMVAMGFGLIEQTKIITAASELARNTLRYGGGGEARIARVCDGARQGLELRFVDAGPGIDDIPLALTDGYTSGGGLGLGLGGAKRLADAFHIDTAPGAGTTVTIAKWKLF
ncbi:serine/threonine-protein kinase RsbT [Janthinobacterium sp. HH104]|uniref:ATP-binding protein n=1 Tax=Janthinobacterium aestuarii TaxID=2985511 RepID=A0ABZ2GK49_9BURK|nr:MULTISPECIES: ATP-binding protein [unclassified Janthinobacterium]MDX8121913.1 ATP-binding protein [Janthinobacterium sp. GMG2]OEZ85179.1 serine/threonine-protein kinase RsbT [Janthinobacterium sp. HH104]